MKYVLFFGTIFKVWCVFYSMSHLNLDWLHFKDSVAPCDLWLLYSTAQFYIFLLSFTISPITKLTEKCVLQNGVIYVGTLTSNYLLIWIMDEI